MDDHDDAPSGKQSTPDPVAEEPKLFGVPMEVFVRGGGATHSMAHEREQNEITEDATRRRAIADQERALSRVPLEHGGGQLYDNPLAPKGSELYVELLYCTKNGDPRYFQGEPVKCLADITLVDAETRELCIILVCPRCKQNGVPLNRCQMRIRQSNRKWELSQKGAGDPIFWVEDRDKHDRKIIKVYRSAGTVIESEVFGCYQCDWKARISDNRVLPE